MDKVAKFLSVIHIYNTNMKKFNYLVIVLTEKKTQFFNSKTEVVGVVIILDLEYF